MNILIAELPHLIAVLVTLAIVLTITLLIRRNPGKEFSVIRLILVLGLSLMALVTVILGLPVSETSRGQLLSFFGIVITAVIALASTTFVANLMAGLMLRAINSFRPGDMIRSDTFFGRVTERGLFHTELQTEDRDLMTLPNMYLVNNPLTVVQSSGTIISASLSLGYDVSHRKVEELLTQAAERSGLQEPFVLVLELMDHAITYRVGGFTNEVKYLLTHKSELRKNVLEVIHDAEIEIVSPSFMNQRRLDATSVIPEAHHSSVTKDNSPEDVIFDKAESAAELESLKAQLREARDLYDQRLSDLKSAAKEHKEEIETHCEELKSQVDDLERRLSSLSSRD